MEFETIAFFDYDIRSTVIDGVRMYLVSDLLSQYNEKHGTNKEFKYYIRNQQTQELLSNWKYVDNSESENSHSHIHKYSDDHWYVQFVIKYITFSKSINDINRGYVVCEELLIACLMWADPSFAIRVYSFLKQCREEDNNFLRKINEGLNKDNEDLTKENKKLTNRYIRDEEDNQWSYVLTIEKDDNDVIIRSRYAHLKYKGRFSEENNIYYVKNLPNGYVFKYNAYNNIRQVVAQYGGHPMYLQKSTFIIPRKNWDADHSNFDADIRAALKQTRVDLCWRNDIELDEDIEY